MGVLEGAVVLDLTHFLAGPYCTMLLGDLGAEVIKVEPPEGDTTRKFSPIINGESFYFLSVNRNKKSLVLDLKTEEGQLILRRLISRADVLVQNYTLEVSKKLGIDYESAKSINPKLVYCSITGFGRDGPYANRPGYDLNVFAISGLMSITGEPDRPPVKPGIPVADIGAGMFAVFGILAALLERQKTGRGQLVDASLLDGQISWLSFQAQYFFMTGTNPSRLASGHVTIVPYQMFATRDSWLTIAVGSEKQWQKLCDVLESPELSVEPLFVNNAERVKNRKVLSDTLQRLLIKRTTKEWLEKMERAGVPCAPVNNVSEALADSQVLSRELVVSLRHPTLGEFKTVGPMRKLLKDNPPEVNLSPPLLGQHTKEILYSLGYTAKKIEELFAMGVTAPI